MKITPKKNVHSFAIPLPVFDCVQIADGVGRDGEEFDLFIGLDEEHVAQLRNLSLDKNDIDLQKNTGDRNRFGLGSYENWYEKSRTPFCLIHKRTNALAALVWFGPKELGKKSIKFGINSEETESYNMEDKWHTISCRSYPSFRGKGLMKNFIQYAINVYKEKFPNIMIWAGTDNRNKPMIKVFSNLGFEINEENSDLPQNWLVMVKK